MEPELPHTAIFLVSLTLYDTLLGKTEHCFCWDNPSGRWRGISRTSCCQKLDQTMPRDSLNSILYSLTGLTGCLFAAFCLSTSWFPNFHKVSQPPHLPTLTLCSLLLCHITTLYPAPQCSVALFFPCEHNFTFHLGTGNDHVTAPIWAPLLLPLKHCCVRPRWNSSCKSWRG